MTLSKPNLVVCCFNEILEIVEAFMSLAWAQRYGGGGGRVRFLLEIDSFFLNDRERAYECGENSTDL